MKKIVISAFILFSAVSLGNAQEKLIKKSVDFAAKQMNLLVEQVDTFSKIPSPRTTAKDRVSTGYTSLNDWTSGFFPGSLWYLYELTGDKRWLPSAVKYTEGMEHIKHFTGNHDIGFMIFCSFGNGLRLTSNPDYKDVIVTAANTLTKRYKSDAGVIQSWNKNKRWECPVIIDNMMNLELLFEATKLSGDSTFWDIAISHADRTMENHYRDDMSCFHVVDYDPTKLGAIRGKYTAQGYADDSAWARGQAWGLYGYTLCYRYTRDPRYLKQAEAIVEFIFNNPNLPKDLVPYWDYDAPTTTPAQPRDASAAAITASALYELLQYSTENSKEYKNLADKIVVSLASPAYTAKLGENGKFVLMHSVGSLPGNSEVDVPLVYADYYFLEALKRKRELEK